MLSTMDTWSTPEINCLMFFSLDCFLSMDECFPHISLHLWMHGLVPLRALFVWGYFLFYSASFTLEEKKSSSKKTNVSKDECFSFNVRSFCCHCLFYFLFFALRRLSSYFSLLSVKAKLIVTFVDDL